MTVKSLHKKVIILPDDTRINRIIHQIKHDGTFKQPTNVRAKVFIDGQLYKVIPADEEYMFPDIKEWRIAE